MNRELIIISEDLLFNYLVNKDSPVMEFDIIKHFLPGGSDQLQYTMFVKHFSIYHALYKLKFTAGLKGYYLHLDCMRLRLIHIQEQGLCRHYYPEKGHFCNTSTTGNYCEQHESEYKDYHCSATFDIMQDFYINPENIIFEDSEILHKLMSGIRTYCFKKKDVDEALDFFDIRKPGKKIITKRYRELAGKYHPDRCSGSEEMMKKINSAYMILKEVYII